jgi:hypothetical protein
MLRTSEHNSAAKGSTLSINAWNTKGGVWNQVAARRLLQIMFNING